MTTQHLAQVNIARLAAPLDSPQLADFVANLDPINALAEQSPGFVWRLKSDAGYATDIQVFDDPMIIINMSVWTGVEALKNFVFNPEHMVIMKRRREWFEKFPTTYMALWWVDAGHEPTPAEARERLESIDKYGPTDFAFTFKELVTK